MYKVQGSLVAIYFLYMYMICVRVGDGENYRELLYIHTLYISTLYTIYIRIMMILYSEYVYDSTARISVHNILKI